jgi:signal transduction histidine kinase/ActR/RegA family two-component response regulator
MNLKQKTFFFVALMITALVCVYALFSIYYVREQESRFLSERLSLADSVGAEFTGLFSRGVERLRTVAELPGLVYGLQTLEKNREGRQIPAWTTLHYLFFQSEVFTDGVYLLDENGRVLWSEPPDVAAIETVFPVYDQIRSRFQDPAAEAAFIVWRRPEHNDILMASRLIDDEGRTVGILVGETPTSHPAIRAVLERNPVGHGVTQLIEPTSDPNKFAIIASSNPDKEGQLYEYPNPPESAVLATAHASPSPWTIVIDQNAKEALASIKSLTNLLTGFGVVFAIVAMGSLLFILRSFTRPIEDLTEAARRIGDGDLSGGFTLDRQDEIGVLSKTLDDMKTKLKSSYDLLLQSEKMALMGQVVAGIAHELNNPLTIVIGNIQLMLMRERNEKNVESLSRIQDGAERASKIVKNLLTFARQETPERKLVNVNTIIRKSVELRSYELRVSNIEISTELDQSLPETMADPHQLQQVFLNLIVNAEHAMIEAHGKGLLRVKSRREEGRILIFFSDDGPGIPNENLHRIFEPFFTTKAVGKGTGLGLSICQGIIVEHGGKIDVESTPGRGTTFVIELPIQKWASETPAVAPPVRVPSVAKRRILVVEDELQIRLLLQDILKALGHQVEVASNGRIALGMMDNKNYDLIITDVKMPELSGAEFYAAIKRKGAALERKVIFVTGDLMNPETLQFVESTGRPWLGKPFDIDAITKTISDCLSETTAVRR